VSALSAGDRSPTASARRIGPATAADDPQERVLARERATDLAAAISELPPGQGEAVVLFHLADLPQKTVASRLDTRVGAVRTRLHKARVTLRRQLTS
jgi:RNA polymerase sigma factor (sigma-70 family)